MFIHVEVSGGASEVVSAFTALSEDAVERGLRVFVEDPVALAQGHGRFESSCRTWTRKATVVLL